MGVLILRTIPQRIFPIHSKVLQSRDDPRLLLSDERAMISRGFRVLQLLRINVISFGTGRRLYDRGFYFIDRLNGKEDPCNSAMIERRNSITK